LVFAFVAGFLVHFSLVFWKKLFPFSHRRTSYSLLSALWWHLPRRPLRLCERLSCSNAFYRAKTPRAPRKPH
jgi:hypothetical protein